MWRVFLLEISRYRRNKMELPLDAYPEQNNSDCHRVSVLDISWVTVFCSLKVDLHQEIEFRKTDI